MLLEQLPVDVQYLVLLDWICPQEVYAVAQTSAKMMESVKTAPREFRAKCRLTQSCIDWFRNQKIALQVSSSQYVCDAAGAAIWYRNGKLIRRRDLPRVAPPPPMSWWSSRWNREDDLPQVVNAGNAASWFHWNQDYVD